MPNNHLGTGFLSRYPALGFPLYRRYWVSSFGSVGGWQISAIAMVWLVYELSGSTVDLGILGAVTALPAIIVTVAGGVIADRYDKKNVLIVTTALNTGLLALLTILAFLELVTVWQIWLIAGVISLVSGVDWPTRQSFFPHLIDRSALLSAVALNSVLWQATRMVLPALGGVLIAASGPTLVFAIATVGYFLNLVVIAGFRLTLTGEAGTSPWHQTLQGVRYILKHSFFRDLILLSYATMLFLSSYMQLMPAFAELVNAGPTGFGLLMSATGLGSILGTVVAGAAKLGQSYGKVMLLGGLTAVLFLAGFALSTHIGSYEFALISCLLAASAISIFLILSTTALQAEVPEALRGRVMGIHGITYSLMPMGALFTGAIATECGSPVALLMSLGVYLLILALINYRAPNVRNITEPVQSR